MRLKLNTLRGKMKQVFEMTGLGKLAYLLGMEFLPTSGGMILHQFKYAKRYLDKFQHVSV